MNDNGSAVVFAILIGLVGVGFGSHYVARLEAQSNVIRELQAENQKLEAENQKLEAALTRAESKLDGFKEGTVYNRR